MSSKLLSDAGIAIYGPRWQSEIAVALGVSDRTVRRWVSGDTAPPLGIWSDLIALCKNRKCQISDVVSALENHCD